jgi:hypothetical protein
MRKTLFSLCALVFIAACAKEAEPKLPALGAQEISGATLWKRISSETHYDDYASWPGLKGMQQGQSPHGKYHEIYINSTLASALPIADRIAPDGAIVVKENFGADKKLASLTVMAKAKGYNPEYGDWFWAAYDPQGKVLIEGKVEGCYECHAGMKDNDFLIVHPLDAALPAGWK